MYISAAVYVDYVSWHDDDPMQPQHKHFHFIVPSRMTMMIQCLDRHAHVRLSRLVY